MTFIPNIPTGSGNSQPDEIRRGFGVVSVSGQSDVIADRDGDQLTLAAGAFVTLTTDASSDTVTIASEGGDGNAWSVLTNGDPVSPELLFDSDGDVIMVEIPR